MAPPSYRPDLKHMGIYVWDLPKMEDFYSHVFGLQVVDRGKGVKFPRDLLFMSGDPTQHHQLVLATGRSPEAKVSTVMQMSFLVPTLDELRAVKRRALSRGVKEVYAESHGNSWSIYFDDPEGNTLEAYVDSPYHVPQPYGDPLDLDKPDAEIMADTSARVRKQAGFMERDAWEKERDASLKEAWRARQS